MSGPYRVDRHRIQRLRTDVASAARKGIPERPVELAPHSLDGSGANGAVVANATRSGKSCRTVCPIHRTFERVSSYASGMGVP